MFDYKYAYLFGSLITLVIWMFFFIKRKDLRKEMLLLSVVTMVLAPTNILYYGEYWKPQFVIDFYNFGIESIIVCFTYGGIVGVIYEYVFRETTYKLRSIGSQIPKFEFAVSFLLGVVSILVLELFTNLNVIYTTSTGMIVMGILFIYFRRDLLIPSIFSGLFSVTLSVVVYWIMLIFFPRFFDLVWVPDTISNIRWLLIPVEEYYFHFALGFAIGVMYEVEKGNANRRIRKSQRS